MSAQILVIMKKEWEDSKSTLFSYTNWLAGLWPILLFCAAFGVYEPLKVGVDWLQSPGMLLSISVLVPFVVIGTISPYAFVGERVRGTLEALLATPVSDPALLFGKIAAAVLFGWGLAVLATLMLMLGALLNSRAAVIGIGLALLFLQQYLVGLVPALGYVLPWTLVVPLSEKTQAIVPALLLGQPLYSLIPIVAVALECLVFMAISVWRFNQEEL